MADSKKNSRWTEFLRACCESTSHADSLLKMHPELLEQRNGTGETALHYLAIENRLEAVKYLIGRGADVNARDHLQKTALMRAVMLGNLETIDFLAAHGAAVNAQDDLGESVLHYANRSEVVELLVRLGADPQHRSSGGYTALDEARFGHELELIEILERYEKV